MTIEQFAVSVILSVIVIIPTTLVAISGRRTGRHQDVQTDLVSFTMMQQQVSNATEKIGALQARIDALQAKDDTRESEINVLERRIGNQGRRIKLQDSKLAEQDAKLILYQQWRTDDQAEIHSLKKQVDDLPKSVEALRQQLRDNNILPKDDPHADAAMQAIEDAKLPPDPQKDNPTL